MSTYKLLTILFYSCLGAATILFILCIILFFKLDIRSAFAERSAAGRLKREQGKTAGTAPVTDPVPEGAEQTVLLEPQDAPAAGSFTIVKKVVCTDTAETIE